MFKRSRLAAITQMAAASEFAPVVRRLGCLRGINTLTAFALAVELGDWHRFTGASIGPFVGLTPAEYSSGGSRTLGPITKTGNTHVRRLLVEAAWHHRRGYTVGRTMRDRWDLAPAAARARGDEGNRRLHHWWVRFLQRRKPPPSPTSPSPANWPAGAGPWLSSTTNDLIVTIPLPRPPADDSAWSDPRSSYEQPPARGPRPTLDTRSRSSRTTALR